MTYTVYKTVNKVNGKFYLGVHKTSDPNDEYLGSGTYIERAVPKYGRENFRKDILFLYDTQEEAWVKENELVELHRKDPLCMNLRKGGSGGFDYINATGLSQIGRPKGIQTIQDLAKKNPEKWHSTWSAAGKKGSQHPVAMAAIRAVGPRQFLGRKHKSSSKQLMSQKAKDRITHFNPMAGMFWITDGTLNKPVRTVEDIPDGWIRGRSNFRVFQAKINRLFIK
jgi:hypothetical protein